MKKLGIASSAMLLCLAVTAAALPMKRLQGQPKLDAGGDFGYFLWHDEDGVHLRWTTKEKQRSFSGWVKSKGNLKDLKRVKIEGNDWIKRTSPSSFTFSTKTDEGLDGVDFRFEGSSLEVNLEVDGHAISVEHIHIGAASFHPKQNPFPVVRE